MNNNAIIKTLFATIIMAAMTNNLAYADSKKDAEKVLHLFSQSKISLIDAINVAEAETGGKALEAELDDESTTVQFEVEVVKDDKIYKVMIDGVTGHVLKVSLEDESKKDAEAEKENKPKKKKIGSPDGYTGWGL